jgi:flagellar protein FlbD
MIFVTKLNGEKLHVNAMQVESLESLPDTRLVLMNGKSLYVRETPDEVLRLMQHWFQRLHSPVPIDVRSEEEY